MFDLKDIQIEPKELDVIGLKGLAFHSYSPWKDNPEFEECMFQIRGREFIKLSQLEKIKKLFKPHDILIPLNQNEDPKEGEFISLLFKKDNSSGPGQMTTMSLLKDYLREGGEPEITTENEDWTK